MQDSYLTQIKDYNIREASPVPGKAALLIIDMQCYFKPLAQPIVDNVISRKTNPGCPVRKHGEERVTII